MNVPWIKDNEYILNSSLYNVRENIQGLDAKFSLQGSRNVETQADNRAGNQSQEPLQRMKGT